MKNFQKVLLLGSSFSAVPIYKALKSMGFFVAVCGCKKNDPLHQYADKSFYIDYSDLVKVQKILESEEFDFLVPSCNDTSYIIGGLLAEKFCFPGYDKYSTILKIHTKNLFRDFLIECGLECPNFITVIYKKSFDHKRLKYPILVKPVDSFSGKGITKVFNDEELKNALYFSEKFSLKKEVVLEEYIEGSLHSHSAFIFNGSILYDFFVDEFCTIYPYQVNSSNHPSGIATSLRNKVRKSINKLAQSLSLTDGLLHTQFMVSGKSIFIIESMRRCPGDLYPDLVEKSTGVEYWKNYVAPFVSRSFEFASTPIDLCYVTRHTLSTNSEHIHSAFLIDEKVKFSKIMIVQLKISGQILKPAPFDKSAIVFLEHKSIDLMFDAWKQVNEHIKLI